MISSEFLKYLERPKEADLQHCTSPIRSNSTNVKRNDRSLGLSNIATLNMVRMLLVVKLYNWKREMNCQNDIARVSLTNWYMFISYLRLLLPSVASTFSFRGVQIRTDYSYCKRVDIHITQYNQHPTLWVFYTKL